jgi:hypothetical protein
MREIPTRKVGQKPDEYREWVCRKCGLLRCNKVAHIHGIPLDEKTLMRAREEDVKARQRKMQPPVGG